MINSEKTRVNIVSDYNLRLVQIVFALVIAQSLVLYRKVILDPFTTANFVPFLALIAVYFTTILSWIDFHRTIAFSPYRTGRGIEQLRLASDLLIVLAYAFLVFSIEEFAGKPNANISRFLAGYVMVFLLYLISGQLRVQVYGYVASRRILILTFFVVFILIWIGYENFGVSYCS